MTDRLSAERLRYLEENPDDVECYDVLPMVCELFGRWLLGKQR